jgi:hypothetical protein
MYLRGVTPSDAPPAVLATAAIAAALKGLDGDLSALTSW